MDEPENRDDVPGHGWPLTSTSAKEAITLLIRMLFEPVLLKTLGEWGQLRQRCRLKAMKRQALGRITGKLQSAQNYDQLADALASADPEEAFALLSALSSLENADHPNIAMMAFYRDELDHRERWYAVVANKALEWAEDQRQLFDLGDHMGYQD